MIVRIEIIRALNESAGILFRTTTKHRQNNSDNQSMKGASRKNVTGSLYSLAAEGAQKGTLMPAGL